MIDIAIFPELLQRAIEPRFDLLDERHESAMRLFNGFYEGAPELVIDLYARTLVMHNYAAEPRDAIAAVQCAQDTLCVLLPWLRAVVVKTRNAGDSSRRGALTFGDAPDTRIRENGVLYSIDLLMNRDSSFYLDTRNLRRWLMDHTAGKTVLNTFAYTGSLGVAAVAGHAQRVVHLDLNRAFLNVAKTTYSLNGFSINKADFINGDFFPMIGAMKRAGARFDCAVVDPPFYSQTSKGKIDLVSESQRVINKVRPLINDGGCLITINNALFTSGADYLSLLNDLCADGYLSIAELIAVPPDITGYANTRVGVPPVDPAPFNHPTKIAILNVRRKEP